MILTPKRFYVGVFDTCCKIQIMLTSLMLRDLSCAILSILWVCSMIIKRSLDSLRLAKRLQTDIQMHIQSYRYNLSAALDLNSWWSQLYSSYSSHSITKKTLLDKGSSVDSPVCLAIRCGEWSERFGAVGLHIPRLQHCHCRGWDLTDTWRSQAGWDMWAQEGAQV